MYEAGGDVPRVSGISAGRRSLWHLRWQGKYRHLRMELLTLSSFSMRYAYAVWPGIALSSLLA